METLADRAARALARHPAPALPLDELLRQVRSGGAAVGPDVLLRALAARPDRFRLLDPWRGAWRSAERSARGRRDPHPSAATPWVVGLGASGGERGAGARLRASLSHLGRTVDERSVTDLMRWVGLVREGERLGLRIGAGDGSGEGAVPPQPAAARTNHPDRHSPSASAASSR